MVDDTGGIEESRMWQAVERLETASQATREALVATNTRVDAIEREQIATNVRLDAIEKEQVAMNTRLNGISDAQHAMTMRLDALEARVTACIDRLFYAIIGGTIAVAASVLVHGVISS